MTRIYLIALFLTAVSCGGRSRTFYVPDHVSSIRSSNDYQLPGTRLFLRLPDDYSIDSARQLVRKNDKVFFRYAYQPGENFRAQMFTTRMHWDSMTQHARFAYTKAFQIGPYSALVYYYPTTKPRQSAILLYFGDRSFTAHAAAVFPTDDPVARDSVFKTMCSLYQDEDARVDVSSSQPFYLDLSHSEFAYYNQTNGAYMFTIGGLHDGAADGPEDFIMVRQTARGHTSPTAWLRSLVDAYRPTPFKISDYAITLQHVDGKPVWELNGRISYGDSTGVVYGVAKGDTRAPLVLFSTVFTDVPARVKEVKDAARTLEPR